MRIPAAYNLTIRKGNGFNELFEFQNDNATPMDLTGWVVKSQIRKEPLVTAGLVVDFTVTIPSPTDGKVYLSLTTAQTSAITVNMGHYDILLTNPSGFKETYVEGSVTFVQSVTV